MQDAPVPSLTSDLHGPVQVRPTRVLPSDAATGTLVLIHGRDPLAVILGLLSLMGRSNLGALEKLLWAVLITFAWGIGPILYILLGHGSLW